MAKPSFDQVTKILGIVGVIGSFFGGVLVWRTDQKDQRARSEIEASRVAETRRIEATKPFLERQLRLYTDATRVAARLATSSDTDRS